VLALALCALALVAAGRGLVRHNTWYLASDQFAFLTFADDLAERGTVFHDPSTAALVAAPSLPREAAVDTYYLTYIYRDGRVYSRYPPGFPLLLAAAKIVGGEAAVHWLNPLLYLLLLAALGVLTSRLAGTSVAAATTMWALLVIPVEVHYWGITVARDLPAHLLALTALLAATSARAGLAGLALGLAASIRPDAALWGLSVAALLPREGRTIGRLVASAAAFGVGALPLFVYNTVTQGNPLAFTQGSEFRHLFQSGFELSWPTFDAVSYVSGGGFRLAHFPSTFPVHVRYLAGSFGAFIWIALGTLLVGAVRRRPIARAFGPYGVVALLFYSCWSHGDPRYLVGVSLCLIALTATGLVEIARGLAAPTTRRSVRWLALTLVVAGLLVAPGLVGRDPARGLTSLERIAALSLVIAAATAALPRARELAPLVPAIAFAAFGGARIAASSGAHDRFQGDQIAQATRTIDATLPSGALVLVTSGIGRPAENITHYTHAEALYLAELFRMMSDPTLVAWRCTLQPRPFYLLLRPEEPMPFRGPPEWQHVTPIARIEGDGLLDWFIDPSKAPTGIVLYRAEIRPFIPPTGSPPA
jgi:hypothetical protein